MTINKRCASLSVHQLLALPDICPKLRRRGKLQNLNKTYCVLIASINARFESNDWSAEFLCCLVTIGDCQIQILMAVALDITEF